MADKKKKTKNEAESMYKEWLKKIKVKNEGNIKSTIDTQKIWHQFISEVSNSNCTKE